MIDETRMLEMSLGDGNKVIEKNEKESVIVQRRSIRATKDLYKNNKITNSSLVFLGQHQKIHFHLTER